MGTEKETDNGTELSAMAESVKITSFEAENVKRVKAVELHPSESGLTVIGGRNNQGKTSILDSIAWALGGERNRPSNPAREGAAGEPRLKVTLSNGIVVERKGKNSALKVTDPNGKKSGQALLDGFTEQLALNLPRFMEQSNAEKAKTLLNIVGVGSELYDLEDKETQLYNQRTAVGQMERQKRGAAEDMAHYPDAPAEPVSATELIKRQQEILARNGENQRKRQRAADLESRHAAVMREIAALADQMESIAAKLDGKRAEGDSLAADLVTAAKTAEELEDESTAEIEASIAEIDRTNAMVRTNQARRAAFEEADAFKSQYDSLTEQIQAVRAEKMGLLQGANLPLEGLEIADRELTYKGAKWDCMSGSDQLKVATAIVRRLKPECGFVLVDKLEQMDPQTLAEFGAWAQGEGLQVIGTRVSTGGECSIVIEDGYGYPSESKAEEERAVDASLRDCAAESGCPECSIPLDGTCEKDLVESKWVM